MRVEPESPGETEGKVYPHCFFFIKEFIFLLKLSNNFQIFLSTEGLPVVHLYIIHGCPEEPIRRCD